MLDVLLPATDAGVAVQLGVWAVATIVALILARRNRDVRLLVVGLSVLTLGLMGIRAIH